MLNTEVMLGNLLCPLQGWRRFLCGILWRFRKAYLTELWDLDVFQLSQARTWNWGCSPVIWKTQKICYLAYHMAAVGHQSRSWECWSADRLVIHMAQMCIYTQDSRFTLGTILQTGKGTPSCQVVMNRKWGMRHHIFFWSVKSSKPNEVWSGLKTVESSVMW